MVQEITCLKNMAHIIDWVNRVDQDAK